MKDFEVSIRKIIDMKISLEAYLVLYSLYTNNKELISLYTKQCKSIDTDTFKELEFSGYIVIKAMPEGNIYYELLSLSKLGMSTLSGQDVNANLNQQFDEFKSFYPSIVKSGIETRRLHGNLKKCKALYNKLLLETTHEILCKCAKAYYDEKRKSNGQLYMQNLETWLNQRNYIQYIEDMDKTDDRSKFTDDF